MALMPTFSGREDMVDAIVSKIGVEDEYVTGVVCLLCCEKRILVWIGQEQ